MDWMPSCVQPLQPALSKHRRSDVSCYYCHFGPFYWLFSPTLLLVKTMSNVGELEQSSCGARHCICRLHNGAVEGTKYVLVLESHVYNSN